METRCSEGSIDASTRRSTTGRAVNKAKAGQTIPLKFKLDGGAGDDLGGLLPVQP